MSGIHVHTNRRQKILSILISLFVGLSVLGTGGLLDKPTSAAAGDVRVIIDVEGYNLGQGYYIEPTQLTLPGGSTAKDATDLLLEQNGKTANWREQYDTYYYDRRQRDRRGQTGGYDPLLHHHERRPDHSERERHRQE